MFYFQSIKATLQWLESAISICLCSELTTLQITYYDLEVKKSFHLLIMVWRNPQNIVELKPCHFKYVNWKVVDFKLHKDLRKKRETLHPE